MLARLDRQSPASNHVDRRRRCIRARAGPADGALLHFALFKELDDIGDIDAAWHASMEGGHQARSRRVHDRGENERLFAALRLQFPLPWPPAMEECVDPIPVFIVGMHRSGTTLLERIQSSHPAVFAHGESRRLSGAFRQAADHGCGSLPDRVLIERAPTHDARRVSECYFAEGIARIEAASHVTDKLPGNFQLIDFIHDAMPQARAIHLRRDPLDLCFAKPRELFPDSVGYSCAIEDVAHLHALCVDLMRRWRRSYPGFELDLDHEDLATNPGRAIRRLLELRRLDRSPTVLDPAMRADSPVNTLGSVQVCTPIHAGSVGRWKPFAH